MAQTQRLANQVLIQFNAYFIMPFFVLDDIFTIDPYPLLLQHQLLSRKPDTTNEKGGGKFPLDKVNYLNLSTFKPTVA